MEHFMINTPRLELIAADREMAEAGLTDLNKLSKLINAEIPDGWPPPLNDEDALRWFHDRLAINPIERGWLMWHIILKDNGSGQRLAIGSIGFKGLPDENGITETGYSIMEDFHRRGFASEALEGLLKWAFAHKNVKMVIAGTYPDHEASKGVMLKNKFVFAGQGSEDGVVRFGLTRERYCSQPI
jgi:RimJ/RimL family protein N-acetyltransferase